LPYKSPPTPAREKRKKEGGKRERNKKRKGEKGTNEREKNIPKKERKPGKP